MKDGVTVGIGAGQMSRIDAVELAIKKAQGQTHEKNNTNKTVVASDAFFPFRDSIDVLANAGVSAIIQPGGSRQDEAVKAAADEHNLAMIFTGHRAFWH